MGIGENLRSSTGTLPGRKIMLVLGGLRRGGTERQACLLSSGLAQLGWEVSLVVLSAEKPEERDELKSGLFQVVYLFERRMRNRLGRLLQLFLIPTRLRGAMKRFRPDIVYSLLELTNFFAAAALPGREGSALVWGFRNSDVPLFGFRRFARELCRLLDGM